MVKSIVSFENLYEYNYSIKNGKILCEDDDMLMEVFGTTYGLDGEKLPIFVGEDAKRYLEELSYILGDSDYSPIYETLGGEFLVWTCMKNDPYILGGDWYDLYGEKDVRLIIHVDRIKGGRLHLSILQAEIL